MGGFASMSRKDLHPRGRKRKTIRHLTQRGARVRSMEKKKKKETKKRKKNRPATGGRTILGATLNPWGCVGCFRAGFRPAEDARENNSGEFLRE